MVTKKSLKQAWTNYKYGIKNSPDASLKTAAKLSFNLKKKGLEMDIRLATLPSLIAPMPKPAADKLQRHIDKSKHIPTKLKRRL